MRWVTLSRWRCRRRAGHTCRRRGPHRIRHRAVFFGEFADLGKRRDIAVHRVQALERDQLRCRRQRSAVLRDAPCRCGGRSGARTGLAHAFDHRIVVQRIGQDQAVRNQFCDRRDAGLVDVARGEQQRGFLAVQIGEFLLELDQWMMGAGNIAGAAGAGATLVAVSIMAPTTFGWWPMPR